MNLLVLLFSSFWIFLVNTQRAEISFDVPLRDIVDLEERLLNRLITANPDEIQILERYVLDEMPPSENREYVLGHMEFLKGNHEKSISIFQKLFNQTGYSNSNYVHGYSKVLSRIGNAMQSYGVLKKGIRETNGNDVKLYKAVATTLLDFDHNIGEEDIDILSKGAILYPEGNYDIWYTLSHRFSTKSVQGYFNESKIVSKWQKSKKFMEYLQVFYIGLQLYPNCMEMIFSIGHVFQHTNMPMCAKVMFERLVNLSSYNDKSDENEKMIDFAKSELLSMKHTKVNDVEMDECWHPVRREHLKVTSVRKNALSPLGTHYGIEKHDIWLHIG